MATAKMVLFTLRSGEQRTYKDVTRIDASRPHLVLVYQDEAIIAQLNKHDVVTHRFIDPVPIAADAPEAADAAAEAPAES